MKRYERPDAVVVEEVSEGVYAASGDAGSSNCWTVSAKSVQDWNGSCNVIEVSCRHSTAVEHISTAVTVVLSFSDVIAAASSENNWSCEVNGSRVTVTRPSHANGYKSGDDVTFKVWVNTGNETTTRALAVTAATISCTKATNVQGGGADGN